MEKLICFFFGHKAVKSSPYLFGGQHCQRCKYDLYDRPVTLMGAGWQTNGLKHSGPSYSNVPTIHFNGNIPFFTFDKLEAP